MEAKFGKVTLALYHVTDHDYLTFGYYDPDNWCERDEDTVRISEPFEVTLVEAEGSHEKVIRNQVTRIEDEIATHITLIEELKNKRARLLAITHEVDDGTD
jgi:hypothetical protein